MSNFFATYATHDCALAESYYKSNTELTKYTPLFTYTTSGTREIASYLYTAVSNFPDFVAQLNSNHIIQKTGMTGSIVIITATSKATKIENLNISAVLSNHQIQDSTIIQTEAMPDHMNDFLDTENAFESTILNTNAWENTHKQLQPETQLTEEMAMHSTTFCGDTLELTLKDIVVESTIRFFLNKQNRIYKIEANSIM